jgi:phosphate-selective porin OprO/OprP
MQNNTKGVRLTRSLLNTAVLVALSAVLARPAAADGLLETLAKKGVLSPEEYEALEQQQNTELRVDTTEGFKLTTADGAFSMQLGTLQQLDFTSYDGSDLSDGTEIRRSRLSFDGRLFKDWQYRVEYEFSGTTGVTDAYVAYTALKPFTVTIGQFKQPFGMEALTSDRTATFIERGLPFAFIITRAPGVMLGSSGRNWSANGGVFGEPVGSVQAGDEGYGLVGRLSYAPLLGASELIHLGAGVTLRKPSDDNSSNSSGPKFSTQRFRAKPESDVLAQRLVDTGEIRHVGLDADGRTIREQTIVVDHGPMRGWKQPASGALPRCRAKSISYRWNGSTRRRWTLAAGTRSWPGR